MSEKQQMHMKNALTVQPGDTPTGEENKGPPLNRGDCSHRHISATHNAGVTPLPVLPQPNSHLHSCGCWVRSVSEHRKNRQVLKKNSFWTKQHLYKNQKEARLPFSQTLGVSQTNSDQTQTQLTQERTELFHDTVLQMGVIVPGGQTLNRVSFF